MWPLCLFVAASRTDNARPALLIATVMKLVCAEVMHWSPVVRTLVDVPSSTAALVHFLPRMAHALPGIGADVQSSTVALASSWRFTTAR